ncbi:MAG: heavy-metal-associated domain-containing protein [Verrucomicrobiota bacterium]
MKFILSISLAFSLLASHGLAADGDPDISSEARYKAATVSLSGNSNRVAVYVKGMVCSSCAIGVKIHLSKIDGVGRSDVQLDSKSQLAFIALKEGFKIDLAKVRVAVESAGYVASEFFRWDGKTVKQIKL